jgi:LysM repeat protein
MKREEAEAQLVLWFHSQSEDHERQLANIPSEGYPSDKDIRTLRELANESSLGGLGRILGASKSFLQTREEIGQKATALTEQLDQRIETFYEQASHDVDLYAALLRRTEEQGILKDQEIDAQVALAKMELFDPQQKKVLEQRIDDAVATREAAKQKVTAQERKGRVTNYRTEGIETHYRELLQRFHSPEAMSRSKRAVPTLKGIRTDLLDLAESAKNAHADWSVTLNETLEEVDERLEKANRHYQRRFFIKGTIATAVISTAILGYIGVQRMGQQLANIKESVTIEHLLEKQETDKTTIAQLEAALTQAQQRTPVTVPVMTPPSARAPSIQATSKTTSTTVGGYGPVHENSEGQLVYVVQRGDTLAGIRRSLYNDTAWQALHEENEGMVTHPEAWVFPGQVLYLSSEGLNTEELQQHKGLYTLNTNKSALVKERAAVPLYTVTQDGTTYAEIANAVGHPGKAAEIRGAWNGINAALGRLREGDRVHLPVQMASPTHYGVHS